MPGSGAGLKAVGICRLLRLFLAVQQLIHTILYGVVSQPAASRRWWRSEPFHSATGSPPGNLGHDLGRWGGFVQPVVYFCGDAAHALWCSTRTSRSRKHTVLGQIAVCIPGVVMGLMPLRWQMSTHRSIR